MSSRTLSTSAFPDDNGLAAPAVRRALAVFSQAGKDERQASYLRAVAALCGSRLLVPVVATARSTTVVGGLTTDKEADMAVVLLQTDDGRRAMLGFTGTDALHAWNAAARPVPVTLDLAARTTAQEGAAALLVDVAGPFPLVLDGEVLASLAQGHRLVALDDTDFGWVVPTP